MAGTMITFPSNRSETKGYLSLPPSGSGPGLLVIQEWWGLSNTSRTWRIGMPHADS